MSGGTSQFDPILLTKEITTDNAADRAAELIAARAALEKQLTDVAEASRKLAEDQARIQAEHDRVQAEALAVRNRQEELNSVHHMRTRSLHEGVYLNATNLFQTPLGPAGTGVGGSTPGVGVGAAPPPPPPEGNERAPEGGANGPNGPPPPERGVGGMGPPPLPPKVSHTARTLFKSHGQCA